MLSDIYLLYRLVRREKKINFYFGGREEKERVQTSDRLWYDPIAGRKK